MDGLMAQQMRTVGKNLQGSRQTSFKEKEISAQTIRYMH